MENQLDLVGTDRGRLIGGNERDRHEEIVCSMNNLFARVLDFKFMVLTSGLQHVVLKGLPLLQNHMELHPSVKIPAHEAYD